MTKRRKSNRPAAAKKSRHASATSKAMIRAVRYCTKCGRGSIMRQEIVFDARIAQHRKMRICRYCGKIQ